jgi:hypothetical protein
MLDLRIELDLADARIDLAELERQIPFATSLAINRLAKASRQDQTEGIFDRFTVRRTAYLRNSVRMRGSTKRDLRAELSIRDPFLVQHEEGGIRRPGDVYDSIVNPVGPTQRRVGVIRGRNTPRAALRSRRAFVAKTASGKTAIFRRRGKKRAPIDLLFVLEEQTKLTPRLQFQSTVEKRVSRDWESEFGKALREAYRTRRGA